MKKILNIILGVLLAVMAVLGIYAIATGGSEASISLNLIWCYVLLALAIASAIFCAIFGMLDYLRELTDRKKHYTEFPPEYDDYADWDVD